MTSLEQDDRVAGARAGAGKDPRSSSRVASSVIRLPMVGSAALALALVAAACGGGKQDKTTPDKVGATGSAGGSGASQAMSDRDPDGGGVRNSSSPGSAPAAGSPGSAPSGAPGDVPAVPGNPPLSAEQIAPTVAMPSYDPEPSQAKAQVDQHLQIARTALSSPTPDADAALREARQALGIDAASIDAAAMVAFAYYHKRLYDTAELVLDDLFKRESAKQNANVYYVYGLVYDRTNRPEQAVLSFKKAVDINPNHASAMVNLGVHELQNSQYTDAVGLFERLVKQFGRSDAVTLTSLGSAYRGHAADYPSGTPDHDDNVRRAEGAYKRALQSTASYGPAYYNLGLLYLDNEPFPGLPDNLLRLSTAKGYFEQYKNMQGVDMKLYDDRMKDVTKAIKRAEKQQKKSRPSEPATPAAPKAKPAKRGR
jgi:tetratricopeptide (TPR) repeat protein